VEGPPSSPFFSEQLDAIIANELYRNVTALVGMLNHGVESGRWSFSEIEKV